MSAIPRPVHWARCLLVAAAVVVAAVGGWPGENAWAQEEELRVKAAFLYKFVGYIDWPSAAFARPDTPVTIAVVGADPLAAELAQAVAGRTVNDRPVTVRRLKPGEALDGVHVLFVGKAENARLPQLAQAAQARSILTVSETDGALAQGSVINFVLAERRVRFEIALDSAEKSRLKLSSRLLAVAQQVRTGTP
jgi:hypothetical protein